MVNKTRWFRRISVQLWGIFIACAALLLGFYMMVMGYSARQNFTESIAPHLLRYADISMQQIVGNPPNLKAANRYAKYFDMRVWVVSPDGKLWASKNSDWQDKAALENHLDNLQRIPLTRQSDLFWQRFRGHTNSRDEGKLYPEPHEHDAAVRHHRPPLLERLGQNNGNIPRDWRNRFGEDAWFARTAGGFLLGVERSGYEYVFEFDVDMSIDQHVKWILLIGTALFLGVLLWLLRWLFAPIREIREGVDKLAAGNLSYRIPVRGRSELGELARGSNYMAQQLKQHIDGQRTLLLGLSHELRTPITRAKLSAAMLEESPQAEALGEDLDEMSAMITELLEAEQLAEQAGEALHREAVDIAPLIQTLVEELGLSDEVEIAVSSQFLAIDVTRMRLLLRNFLHNAVRHHRAEFGKIRVFTEITEAQFAICVQDFGEGIDEAHLSRLTDAFYRSDQARDRQSGGVGLGLYLCKMIAEAHGAKLEIHSSLGEGSTFAVIFESES